MSSHSIGEVKKAKIGDGIRKVAEIVLVLDTMGKIRGGEVPSVVEMDMMEDARAMLLQLSHHFAPKDVFPTHAFASIIQDLSLHTCTSSSHKLIPMSTSNSTSLPYQLPTSQVRPGIHPSALPFPRPQRPYFSLNGKPDSYPSQLQVNFSGDNTKIPTWTAQSQASSLAKNVSDSNPSFHASVKGGAPGMSKTTSQATISRPFITQTTSVNPLGVHQHIQQGTRFKQSPSQGNSYDEIGKTVQKILQQQVPKYPIWTPPSRDYMNKALPCQICKVVFSEVDNVLVCDACEKGHHLNCLQMLNPKSLPEAEWQCGKCFSLNGGKPLPPKYGRVTRNSTLLKASSQSTETHLSVDKNAGIIDMKDKFGRTTENGNSGKRSAPMGALEKLNNFQSTVQSGDGKIVQGNQGTSTEDVKIMQRNASLSSNGTKAEDHLSEPIANNLVVTLGASSVTHSDLKVERSIEEKVDPKCNSQPLEKFVTAGRTFDDSQAGGHNKGNDQTELTNRSKIFFEQCPETNIKVSELSKSCGEDFLEQKMRDDAKKDKYRVSVGNYTETAGACIGPEERSKSLADNLHDVDWIGDIVQVVDEKTYYQSCSLSGVIYKVQDHALFRLKNNILTPFKLQSMWEDGKTRSKWVFASRCYFPADLPEAVGRPYSPEINEVYESNHDTILSASLIEGPCEVLPPRTFIKETERRTCFRSSLYICKWFYDERKGLFRAVTN